MEAQDDIRLADLHIWAVGPNIYSAILSIVTHHPQPPEYYKNLIPEELGVVHTSIEVHRCDN
jgi:Co/Zn/Cd efflux system component